MSPNLRRLMPALAAVLVIGLGVYVGGTRASGDAGAGCAGAEGDAPPDTSNLGEASEESSDSIQRLVTLDESHFVADTPTPELQAALDAVRAEGVDAVPVIATQIRDQGCTEPSSAELVGLLTPIIAELPNEEVETLVAVYGDLLSHLPHIDTSHPPLVADATVEQKAEFQAHTQLTRCSNAAIKGLETAAAQIGMVESAAYTGLFETAQSCPVDSGPSCGELIRILGVYVPKTDEWTARFADLTLSPDPLEPIRSAACDAAVIRGHDFREQREAFAEVPAVIGGCLVRNASKFDDPQLVANGLTHTSPAVVDAAADALRDTGTIEDLPALLRALKHAQQDDIILDDKNPPPLEAAVLAILARNPDSKDSALDEAKALAAGDEPLPVRIERLRERIEAVAPPQ